MLAVASLNIRLKTLVIAAEPHNIASFTSECDVDLDVNSIFNCEQTGELPPLLNVIILVSLFLSFPNGDVF